MKKIIIFFVLLFLSARGALAQNAIETTVAENPINTHNEIYFDVGERVEAVGKKFGDDVYLMGEEVRLDGVIKGDVLTVTGDGVINGIIEQDLRVIGGNVVINAQVMGNVAIAGGNVKITDKAIFYKNLTIAAYNSQIEGQILGRADIYSYLTEINTTVNEDWQVRTFDLSLGERFENNGSLTYYAPAEMMESSASASLNYVKSDLTMNVDKWEKRAEYWAYFTRLMIAVNSLFALVLGYLLMKKYDEKFEKVTLLKRSDLKMALKKGVRTWVVLVVLTFLLAMTGIGLGPAIVLIAILISLGFLSNIVMSFVIGRLILIKWKLKERRGFALLTGLVFNVVMSTIPLLGPIYKLLITATGIGIILNIDKKK